MKLSNLFENAFTDHRQIKDWLDRMGVWRYTINDNGVVDVESNVDLCRKDLTIIPVQFGYVSGTFNCAHNHLTSLKGSPREVGGNVLCIGNNFNDLVGGPREVGGYFDCMSNNLKTLRGAPTIVGGEFYCGDNQLTDLQGAPREVGSNFWCTDNLFKQEPDPSFINIGGEFIWDNMFKDD